MADRAAEQGAPSAADAARARLRARVEAQLAEEAAMRAAEAEARADDAERAVAQQQRAAHRQFERKLPSSRGTRPDPAETKRGARPERKQGAATRADMAESKGHPPIADGIAVGESDETDVFDEVEARERLDEETMGAYDEKQRAKVFGEQQPQGLGLAQSVIEMDRRRAAAKQYAPEAPEEEEADLGEVMAAAAGSEAAEPADWRNPHQRYVVVNLGGRALPPLSAEACVRLCYVTVSGDEAEAREEALAWARRMAEAEPRCSCLIWPAHQWRLMANSAAHLQSAYAQPKIERIAELTRARHERRRAEFQKQVKEHRAGPLPPRPPQTQQEPRPRAAAAKGGKHETKAQRAARAGRAKALAVAHSKKQRDALPFPGALRGHLRYAAVAFLSDLDCAAGADAEPLFMFLEAFAELPECKRYIKEQTKLFVPPWVRVLDCVDLYQWLYPEGVDAKQIPTHYDNQELDTIMKRRDKEKNRKAAFVRHCEEQKMTVPITSIDSKGAVRSVDMHGKVTRTAPLVVETEDSIVTQLPPPAPSKAARRIAAPAAKQGEKQADNAKHGQSTKQNEPTAALVSCASIAGQKQTTPDATEVVEAADPISTVSASETTPRPIEGPPPTPTPSCIQTSASVAPCAH